MDVHKGIDQAVKIVVEEIKKMSKDISDLEGVWSVALISANGVGDRDRAVEYS